MLPFILLADVESRVAEVVTTMQKLEQDANEALDEMREELDGMTGTLEMHDHTKAGNDKVNQLAEWVQTGELMR